MQLNSLPHQLRKVPIFSGLSQEKLALLTKGARLVHLQESQHLFQMGEPAQAFFLLVSGEVTLYRPSHAGENKIFRIAGENSLLVETVMFIDSPYYPLSAQANSEVYCYCLGRENLLALCQQSPEFCLTMLNGMGQSISQAINRIDLLTTSNAGQRLAMYLIDLYLQQRCPWLTLTVNQQALARQLNVASETLSRLLKKFRHEGFIGEQNPEIVLLDIEGLCKAVSLPLPNLNIRRTRSESFLGNSLFDCCDYAKQHLGKIN